MGDGSWLEEVWAEREERIFPTLFGPLRGIFPIPAEQFARFDVSADPRWLTIGVFESAPTATRDTWMYLTSGLSNPWDGERETEEPCGYGCELAIETTTQAQWPIRLLHHLASIQLVTMSGRVDRAPLELGDRVALHGGIDGGASILRHVLLTEPIGFDPILKQRSGTAEWLFCVGLSDAEKAFAREHGNEELLSRLSEAGAFPLTDPTRVSLEV